MLSLFLGKHIKEWGNTASGRVISWKGGEPGSDEKYRYIQIYDIKVSDPESFKKAHDKVIQQLSKAIGDRTVGFGSYDIGGYNGASHWVLVSAENWDDLMLQKVEYEKYTKEEIVISFPIGHWEVEKILKGKPKKEKEEFYKQMHTGKKILEMCFHF